MGNVYRQDNQRLHELLDRASGPVGATVLIPDLQRPYLWTPNQVTLLLDSLIRGWPFGTLLLWKVNHQELQGIPFRPFWATVDRVDEPNGGQVTQMNPPAEFHMVLDGQQRVQSLLLALGGDDWGFKLEDRDWTEEIKERRPRGRQAKYKHWSKASLCFDLQTFTEEYQHQGNNLLGPTIDLRQYRENCLLLDTANEVLNHIADRLDLDGSGSGTLSLPVNLYADDHGAIAASGTFLNAVIGAKADRIRKCAICRHIFWARRSNSECCSLTCRKRWNQRNSRENRQFKKRAGKKGR